MGNATVVSEPAEPQIYTSPGGNPSGFAPPESFPGGSNGDLFGGTGGFNLGSAPSLTNNTGHSPNDTSWLSPQFMENSGPVPGVIGITPQSPSVKALRNYNPKNGSIEFIYEPRTDSFFVGLPKTMQPGESPHQSIVRVSGADTRTVVGGMFNRGADGRILTNEYSGHYGNRWNNEIREKFVNSLEQKTGVKVDHEMWSNH